MRAASAFFSIACGDADPWEFLRRRRRYESETSKALSVKQNAFLRLTADHSRLLSSNNSIRSRQHVGRNR